MAALSIEAHACQPSPRKVRKEIVSLNPANLVGGYFISIRLQAPSTPSSDCTEIHKTNKTTTNSKSSKKEKAWKPGLESRLIQGFL